MRRSTTSLLLALILAVPAVAARQQTPAVADNVLRLDVWVGGRDRQPAPGLTAGDFVVEVDGQARPVLQAEFLDYRTPNGQLSAGRVIALVVDDLSFSGTDGQSLTDAAARWVSSLHPDDRFAVFTTSAPEVPATPFRDRAGAAEAVDVVLGQMPVLPVLQEIGIESFPMNWNELRILGAAEALCASRTSQGRPCGLPDQDIKAGMFHTERNGLRQLDAIVGVLRWLRTVDGPRALVIVSRGIPVTVGTGYLSSALEAVGVAGVAVYAVTPEVNGVGQTADPDASAWNINERFAAEGLDRAIDHLGGLVLHVGSDADGAFAEIRDELSGFYRLAVEIPPGERLPPSASLDVAVRRDGLLVRTGTRVSLPPSMAAPASVDDRVRGVLDGTPEVDVPVDTTTSIARDETGLGVVVTSVITVPESVPGPLDVTLVLVDEDGDEVHRGTTVMSQPAAGAYRTSLVLPVAAGRYRLRLAVVDANGRVGSADTGVLARLRPVGPYFAGDPQVAWRDDAAEWAALGGEELPAVARAMGVTFMLYSTGLTPPGEPSVTLSLRDADDREVATRRFSPVSVENGWRVSTEIDVEGLEAGAYTVALTLDGATDPLPVVARIRKTTVAATARATTGRTSTSTSASTSTSTRPSREEFLSTLQADMGASWPPFRAADVLTPASALAHVSGFAREVGSAVPPVLLEADGEDGWWSAVETTAGGTDAVADFCRALVALRAGEAAAAERALMRALSEAPASASVMVLLGAAHALGGRDGDAIGAWQMALGQPGIGPEWTLALADALGRAGEADAALDLLQDPTAGGGAAAAERAASALVSLGRWSELRSVVERALNEPGQNREAWTFLSVALAYADALGAEADDLAVQAFNTAASRYVEAEGEQADLVRRWMSSLAP